MNSVRPLCGACATGGQASRRKPRRQPVAFFASGVPLTLGVLATLAPKCPLCLAAYLSFIGLGATAASLATGIMFPAGVVLIALTLGIGAYRLGSSRRHPARAPLPNASHERIGRYDAQRVPRLAPVAAALPRH